jgi:hypothetical protein
MPSPKISPSKDFTDPCYNMDESLGHYLNEISQTQKRQILHDSTYVRYLEKSNSWKQKADWWLSELGVGRKMVDAV